MTLARELHSITVALAFLCCMAWKYALHWNYQMTREMYETVKKCPVILVCHYFFLPYKMLQKREEMFIYTNKYSVSLCNK